MLVIIGFGGLVVGIALLHHRIQLAAFLKHLAEVAPAFGRDQGGKPDGNRHKQQNRQSQPPVFPQHHAGDDDDLEKAHHDNIHHIVNGGPHVGNILLHPVQDLPGRSFVDVADRQPRELIRKGNAQIAGIVPADHLVHQVHFAGVYGALQQVHCRQQPASRQQRRGKALCGALPRPGIVQQLNPAAEQFGSDDGAGNHHHTKQRRQQQPAVDGAGIPYQPAEHRTIFSFFLLVHRRSPPVCE